MVGAATGTGLYLDIHYARNICLITLHLRLTSEPLYAMSVQPGLASESTAHTPPRWLVHGHIRRTVQAGGSCQRHTGSKCMAAPELTGHAFPSRTLRSACW
jgi:hypothetical protein